MYIIGNITLVVLAHDNTYNHLHSLGIIECIVYELVRARIRVPPFWPTLALNSSYFQIYDGEYMCAS
jgi:hypothetical protein